MRFKFLALFGFVFILSSCYNKNFQEPEKIAIQKQPTEVIVAASFDRTWAATQRIFTKFPISKRGADDSSSRAFIVTDWIDGKSDILYSGYDVNRIPYQIRYKLYVYVIGAPGGRGTQVKIENVEEYKEDVVTAGVDLQGSLMSWIRTDSSTQKEARLLKDISSLAKNPKFSPQ